MLGLAPHDSDSEESLADEIREHLPEIVAKAISKYDPKWKLEKKRNSHYLSSLMKFNALPYRPIKASPDTAHYSAIFCDSLISGKTPVLCIHKNPTGEYIIKRHKAGKCQWYNEK